MKYWNQKDIPYACCQFITAINARIFLGKEVDIIPSKIKEDPDAQIFEVFVGLTGCRYGSCISVKKAWRYLRLCGQYGPQAIDWIEDRLYEGRPVGIECYCPDYGFHSTLCIDANKDNLFMANWEKGREYSKVPKNSIRMPINALWRPKATAFSLRR